MRVVRTSFVASGLLAVLLAGSGAAATQRPAAFEPPVLLTPVPGSGGFEPGLVVDRFDNVWVTAHHSYGPAVADAGSPAGVRSASFLWMSRDGKTFANPPGSTQLNAEQQYPGDEADLAVDANGGVFFLDLAEAGTNYTFSAWKATGPGRARLSRSTPALPAAFAFDRPFIAAGGDGQLLISENTLGGAAVDRRTGPDHPITKGATGLYVSHDGGATLTTALPYVPDGADAFCRPLVEHRDARRMVAVCTTSASDALVTTSVLPTRLVAFVSSDGGDTWVRHPISGPVGLPSDAEMFLSVAQDPDGTLHVLYHQQPASGTVRLLMFTSRDHGMSWARRDVTPLTGIWNQASIASAPNGMLGLAGYYRPNAHSSWQFRAAVFNPASSGRPVSHEIKQGQVVLAPSDAYAPGEFTQAAFDHESRLRVTYAVRNLPATPADSTLDKHAPSFAIYYAQQR